MIKAAVLGKPIGHSLSPLVHGLIYEHLGIDHRYEKFELDQQEAKGFIKNRFANDEDSWSGFSLTMPLKEIGFELGMEVDSDAFRAHSINTITRQGCFNTDITGLRRVFRIQGVNPPEVIILGSGATARSVLVAIESLEDLSRTSIYRRSDSRDHLLPISSERRVSLRALSELGDRHIGPEVLLISTLPASAQQEVSPQLVGFEGTLLDISYSPWPSILAGVVEGSVISGLPVLVAQAIDQARLFSGLAFDEDQLYRSILLSTIQQITRR